MLKGYRAIDKYLTSWCVDNGFNVRCRMSTDFSYIPNKKIVYYTLVVPLEHNDLFEEICRDYMNNVASCDNFVLSFFHELGHYMTNAEWNDDEWDEYYNFLNKLNGKSKLTVRDYKKYYNHPIELSATVWGCNFIDTNLNKIKNFISGLTPLVTDFYSKNKVDIEE